VSVAPPNESWIVTWRLSPLGRRFGWGVENRLILAQTLIRSTGRSPMLLGISGITAALLADRRMRRCRFPTRCHYVHLEGAWLSPKPAIPRAANTPYGAAPPARAARMPAVAKHRPQDSNMAQLDQIVDPSDGPLSSGQRSPGNDSDRQKSAMRGRRKRAIGAPRTRARSALLRVAATNPSSRTRTVHRVFNSPTALELSTTSKTDPARSAGTSRIAR
jgi:hypothetical protein